jgi:deoxynucleotide monophosphate kinase-like protein
MKVIGLTGAAGSGKDTACGYALAWCEAEGYVAERVAFADPLKVSAARALGAPAEWTTEQCVEFCNEVKQPGVKIAVFKEHKDYVDGTQTPLISNELFCEVTGREYLQFYGTEAHRDVFGETFWQDVTAAVLDEKMAAGVDVVFITDTRFPNEGQFVANIGEVWSVERPLETKVEAHASEIPLPDALITCIINNTGTLEELRDQVRLVCEDRLEVA